MRLLAVLVFAVMLAGCLADTPTDSGTQNSSESSPVSSTQTASSSSSSRPSSTSTTSTKPASNPDTTEETNNSSPENETENAFVPHVLIGTHDSSLNVYHNAFYRPERTQHPCTYLQGLPCSLKMLPLSVGGDDLEEMMALDAEVLASFDPSAWYWIPKTPFVAVTCGNIGSDSSCLLPKAIGTDNAHGTQTVSAMLTESPNASIAFVTSSNYPGFLHDAGIDIDIMSVSTIPIVPLPVYNSGIATGGWNDFIDVQGAGNIPVPTLLEGTISGANTILVGGAYDTPAEEAMASKIVDVVSYYCRPLAWGWSAGSWGEGCGTSFSAPTVAGALAEAILQVRETSGYLGRFSDGVVDPILGITVGDLRTAMNHSASYDPGIRFGAPGSGAKPVPLNSEAPWLQFGWGFVDGRQSELIASILLGAELPAKPDEAVAYMEAVHFFRQTYYGD